MTHGCDTADLQRNWMKAFAADHLILEVASDCARLLQTRDVGRACFRVGGIGAFKIHRKG